MKLKLSVILILLIGFNISAQQKPVNKIPIGSKENVIKLLINNQTSENLKQIKIEAIVYPDWVNFRNTEIIVTELNKLQKKPARFIFDVDKSAPGDSNARISFRIEDQTGKSYIRNINFVVSAPVDFELFQNYPNPFNPSTIIKYSIPKAGVVTLKVYDVLGKEIVTLVNEMKEPGLYTLEFNPSNLPDGKAGLSSGVYFYTLKTEDPSKGSGQSFIQTKKMILLR